MKRATFKKPFNGVDNALKLIPEAYKVDRNEFELTDGVETYRVRWESELNEGTILVSNDSNMINEDMQKIKHLMNFNSKDNLGTLKGGDRIDENKSFADVWKKTHTLINENALNGGMMGFVDEGDLSENEVAEEEVTARERVVNVKDCDDDEEKTKLEKKVDEMTGGFGFSNEGNMNGNEALEEKEIGVRKGMVSNLKSETDAANVNETASSTVQKARDMASGEDMGDINKTYGVKEPNLKEDEGDDVTLITSIKGLNAYKKADPARKLKRHDGMILLIDNDEQIEYYFEELGGGQVKYSGEEEFDEWPLDEAEGEESTGSVGLSDIRGKLKTLLSTFNKADLKGKEKGIVDQLLDIIISLGAGGNAYTPMIQTKLDLVKRVVDDAIAATSDKNNVKGDDTAQIATGAPISPNESTSLYENMGMGSDDSVHREFFITRFGRQPENDPSYYRTWVERLTSYDPYAQMDNESREVWDSLNQGQTTGGEVEVEVKGDRFDEIFEDMYELEEAELEIPKIRPEQLLWQIANHAGVDADSLKLQKTGSGNNAYEEYLKFVEDLLANGENARMSQEEIKDQLMRSVHRN